MSANKYKAAVGIAFAGVIALALMGLPAAESALSASAISQWRTGYLRARAGLESMLFGITSAIPAQASLSSEAHSAEHSAAGKIAHSPNTSSTNFILVGGYGAFSSGAISTPLQSTHYQMLVSAGEMGLPNNRAVIGSNSYRHMPGFLASLYGTGLITFQTYLPAAQIPLPPPVLNAIAAPGANKNFNVSWSAVAGTTTYILEEDSNSAFTNPSVVYNSTGLNTSVQSRGVRTAYYRVRAQSASGGTSWSNIQSVALRWEMEPNNYYTQSTQFAGSGQNVYGLPNDAKDFFSINVPASGLITVTLTGHTANGVQLQLFYRTVITPEVSDTSSPYQLTYNGQAGLYYIYIYAPSGYNSSNTYTLKVTYPSALAQDLSHATATNAHLRRRDAD